MTNFNFQWLYNLTRLGTFPEAEDDISRRIIFSNVIFISLPLVYLIFMIIDYESFLQPIHLLRFDQFIVPIVIFICVCCLVLNKVRFTKFSRIIFIILWPFLLHIIPIKLLETPLDYYIAFPFGIVFHSLLIQLMFSHLKEWFLFWFCLVLNFAVLVFASDILIYFVNPENLPNELAMDRYYTLDGILYWLLFNLVMFYVLYVVETYIKKVNDSKKMIESQKEKLNQLNQNLEGIVKKRTIELEKQNTKLVNYAYYNAHLLRAPFCRIKGLVHLQELLKDTDGSTNEVELRLRDSIDEFEEVIIKINEIVHEENTINTKNL